jgi:hypothetical protein
MWPATDLGFDNYKTTHFKFKYLVPERGEKSEGWSLYPVSFLANFVMSSQIWLFAICEFLNYKKDLSTFLATYWNLS